MYDTNYLKCRLDNVVHVFMFFVAYSILFVRLHAVCHNVYLFTIPGEFKDSILLKFPL